MGSGKLFAYFNSLENIESELSSLLDTFENDKNGKTIEIKFYPFRRDSFERVGYSKQEEIVFNPPPFIYSIIYDALLQKKFFYNFFKKVKIYDKSGIINLYGLFGKLSGWKYYCHFLKDTGIKVEIQDDKIALKTDSKKLNIGVEKENVLLRSKGYRFIYKIEDKIAEKEFVLPFAFEEFREGIMDLYNVDFKIFLRFINLLAGVSKEGMNSLRYLSNKERFVLYKNIIMTFEEEGMYDIKKLWPTSIIRLYFNFLYIATYLDKYYLENAENKFLDLLKPSFEWIWRYIDLEKELYFLLDRAILDVNFRRKLYNYLLGNRLYLRAIFKFP